MQYKMVEVCANTGVVLREHPLVSSLSEQQSWLNNCQEFVKNKKLEEGIEFQVWNEKDQKVL